MSKYRSAAGVASGDREPTLPLRRVPSKGKIGGIITTLDVREVWTHYHRGRTVGCSRPMCPGCKAGAAMRYEGYIGLYSPSSKKHCILGLTVGAVRQVVDQVGRLDRIRGLVINAWRSSARPNARVIIETGLMAADMSALPAQFCVLEHLSRIWGAEAMEDINQAVRQDDIRDHRTALRGVEASQEHVEREKQRLMNERWTLADGQTSGDIDGQTHLPFIDPGLDIDSIDLRE